MGQAISVLVFDFDGTLVESNAIKRRAFFDSVDAHAGGAARMARILDRVTGDRSAVFTAYVADAVSHGQSVAQDAAALVQCYSERVDTLVAAAPEMPGALSLLEQLRHKRYRAFVNSATPLESLKCILERRNWLHFFEAVFGHPMSKRESVMRVLHSTGIEPASLAIIGDGADDRECAAWVGCTFFPVGEARGAARPEKVYTLTDLQRVLLGGTT